MVPFAKAIQIDCKTVQLLTASDQRLKYKIVESSDRHLKFNLSNDFEEIVPAYQKETLFKRFQPTEYDIQIASETEIKIEKKMRLFDPLCKKKKNGFDVVVTELFSWAKTESELPLSYEIEKRFLVATLSSLKMPPWVEPDKAISIASIKEIMMAPLQDEIKICD